MRPRNGHSSLVLPTWLGLALARRHAGPSAWLIGGLFAGLAAIPRVIWPGVSEYKLDESTAVLTALDALHRHVVPLQGQGSSVAGAAQGPLLYDLVAVVLAIQADPRLVVATIGLINALAVGLTYVACCARFGRRAAFMTAVLFALGPWAVVFSRKIWPNDLLAPAAAVALWGLLRAMDPKTKVPGIGRSWVALAVLVSLNFGAWPEAIVPAFATIALPRTRRGRAAIWSSLGFSVFAISLVARLADIRAILTALLARPGGGRDLNLAPFAYIVQLAGTDAYQLLAGPSAAFQPGWPIDLVGLALRVTLFASAATAIVHLVWRRVFRSSAELDECIVLLWWLAPAVASVAPGSIEVYVHHFVGTLPSQFILIALGISRIETGLRWLVDVRIGRTGRGTNFVAAIGSGLVWTAAGVQLASLVAFLEFVSTHPSDTFFGTPLSVSMSAASQMLLDRRRGPVVMLSSGDEVGVDTVPTVMASLTDSADLIYVDTRHTIVIPGDSASTLYVAPDARADALDLTTPWQQPAGPLRETDVIGGSGGFVRFEASPVGTWRPADWQALEVPLDDGAAVLSASLPRQAQSGQPLTVDVAWRVGEPPARPVDQSVFAHLVADSGATLADLDFSPLPLHVWHAGDVVVNRFSLRVPDVAVAGRYWVDVGRYRRPDLEPVRLLAGVQPPGATSLRLGPLTVPPLGRPVRGFVSADTAFGNQIRLAGWKVQERQDLLYVTLRWTPLVDPTGSYTIFVHLLDASGRIVAQNDSEPSGGEFPTSTWETSLGVSDTHQISLDSVPTGQYRVEIGIYQASTGQRLPVGSGDSDILTTIAISSPTM
jgi:hypothetical protein